jgi:lambda family phage portal protein
MATARNRTHDAVRNDWAGEAAVTRWTTNLVGVGFTPRFHRIKSKKRRQEVVDLWNKFVARADADCVLNFHGMTTLAVRSWLESGECFARLRPRPARMGLDVPLQVQLLESEFVPFFDADVWIGMAKGNTIRQGIERNIYGERIAYWMYKEHPGDGTTQSVPTPEAVVRVLAENVVHLYEPKRPGQLRGTSILTNVLTRLRSSGDLEDAVLDRMKLANLFVAFIKNEFKRANADVDPITGQAYDYDPSSSTPFAAMEPGLIQELDPGQSIDFANPPEPGVVMPDYLRTVGLGTAAGANLPYEIMSGDIREVSDRTLRVVILEFRRLAEQRQWQIIIPMWCQKIVEGFARAATLVGKLAVGEFDAVTTVEWSPHGWEYIHPVQDPEGKKIEVEAGFRSRSSVIASRGDDPDTVDEERAADQQREEALKIKPVAKSAPQLQQQDPNQPKGG